MLIMKHKFRTQNNNKQTTQLHIYATYVCELPCPINSGETVTLMKVLQGNGELNNKKPEHWQSSVWFTAQFTGQSVPAGLCVYVQCF